MVHLISAREEVVDHVQARLIDLFEQAARRRQAGLEATRTRPVRRSIADTLLYVLAAPLAVGGIVVAIVQLVD